MTGIRSLILVFAGLIALLLSGCTTRVAVQQSTEGTAVYEFGRYRAILAESDMQRIFYATNTALDTLGMLRVGETVKEDSMVTYARATGDYKVSVRLSPAEDDGVPLGTQVVIRYGMAGSLPKSQQVFWEIRKQLGKVGASPSAPATGSVEYVNPDTHPAVIVE